MRTGGYGGPVGFLVKKYTCPVIFLGCPGRPGLVFVGPWTSFTVIKPLLLLGRPRLRSSSYGSPRDAGWGVVVLPDKGYIDMCGPKGMVFQPFWS